MNRKSKIIPLLVFFTLFLYSCKKFVEVPQPNNQLLKSNVFTTDQSATSTIAGIYSSILADVTLSSTIQIAMALSSDELIYRSSDVNVNDYYSNNVQLINSNNLAFWSACYKAIYSANSAIEGLTESIYLSDSTQKRLLGEAKFIRAFSYFQLITLWGDVPLVISTDYSINSSLPRSPMVQIISLIKEDLKEAQNLLSVTYIAPNRTRPNKWAATALLARVYMYENDFVNAEAQANELIINGGYSLATVTNAFLLSSIESIWQLYPSGNTYTWIASSFLPANANTIPTFPVNSELISAFEPGDQRKTNWLKVNTIAGITYYYPNKYKSNSGTVVSEGLIVFRLAELYLIRAEARAMQNNILGALADLNIIRSRANILSSSANTQETLISAIERERRVELFTEWGDRWLYLKRSNKASLVLGPIKGTNWQATDVLWPIPKTQIDANPFLSPNNPGY